MQRKPRSTRSRNAGFAATLSSRALTSRRPIVESLAQNGITPIAGHRDAACHRARARGDGLTRVVIARGDAKCGGEVP